MEPFKIKKSVGSWVCYFKWEKTMLMLLLTLSNRTSIVLFSLQSIDVLNSLLCRRLPTGP